MGAPAQRSCHKVSEEGMGAVGAALKLGMELHAHIKAMRGYFNSLYQAVIG